MEIEHNVFLTKEEKQACEETRHILDYLDRQLDEEDVLEMFEITSCDLNRAKDILTSIINRCKVKETPQPKEEEDKEPQYESCVYCKYDSLGTWENPCIDCCHGDGSDPYHSCFEKNNK